MGAAPVRPIALPTPAEQSIAARWAAAHLRQPGAARIRATTQARVAGLVVLSNNGPVQLNARGGAPLRIGGVDYTRGLYCHAPSHVVVRLPGPARSFSAAIGIDDHANGGTVVYHLRAGGKELYRSDVRTCGKPAEKVAVELGGAAEFALLVDDAGDGISCDQANWADAQVTLTDGRSLWLGDMAILADGAPLRTLNGLPFAFTYGGKSSDELLPRWAYESADERQEDGRILRRMRFTEPGPGLEVRCDAVLYGDYPVVEWTLHFANLGKADSPIVEGIRALDTRFDAEARAEVSLHRWLGSICAVNDYEPIIERVKPEGRIHVATSGGRPTNSDMPMFNLEYGDGGVLAVLSWAGQWCADIERDKKGPVRVSGGQEQTHFTLHPGEQVRGPMAVLQFYQGDPARAQNTWRRWMRAHNLPSPDGKPIAPMMSACNGNHYPGIITNAAEEKHFLSRYLEEAIQPGWWWEDAGWYPCDPVGWPKTGTWEVEPSRWPEGIRGVSDWARKQGIRTIVWFEPERVHAGTWLAENHPEWIMGGKAGGLLRIGDPQCRAWLTDHISRLLTVQGIDLYRQDFNIDPLSYWRSEDADDRQGIAEIRHVEGYFAYWDELLKRHPGMLIDSCASGGRRNDLETLRRAVPLLRSDFTFDALGEQCHTYGIASWIPFHGTGFLTVDPYLIRSQMSPEFTLGVDTRRRDQDYDLLRKMVAEWKRVGPCLLGDYWPVSPYSKGNDTWMAWQFDLPEEGRGVVQAFRRADCPGETYAALLHGLDPNAYYGVEDADGGEAKRYTGAMLMGAGFVVTAKDRAQAKTYFYRKLEK